MNRKPTTSETNTKPTTKGVSNYAAAAKRSSQIQDQQPQQRSSTAQSNASTSVNQSTKGKGRDASVNGKNTGDSAPQSAVNEETSDMTTPPNTMARKQNQAKNARNASVQLPRAPPQDVAPIQFGSINQVTEPVPVSSIRDDGSPILNTTEVTFGTMPASDGSNNTRVNFRMPEATDISRTTSAPPSTDNNNKLFTQPYAPQGHHQQQRRDSAQSNHSEQGSPAHFNNSNSNNNHTRHYRHQNYPQNKHSNMGHSPNIQHSQPYMPHQKKTISPHMQTAQSPAVSGQNMIGHVWPSPGPAPHTGYYPQQPYSGDSFYGYSNMGYAAPNGNATPGPLPVRASRAIRIIDPNTMTDIFNSTSTSSAQSTTPSTPPAAASPAKSEAKKEESKPADSPAPSKAIPIVDPAIKDREARERREREEEERKAKEDAERKEREEKERAEAERKAKEEAELKAKEEAERKAKEEAERKAKEEQERLEAERKAKEEAERKAKEEAERKAKEEAERKAKEEAEKKAAEEAELKAKEEAERKAKEEAEKKAAEEAAKKEEEAQKKAEDDKKKEEEEAEKKKKAEAPGRLDMSAVSKSGAAPATPATATPSRTPKTPSGPMRTIDDPSTIQYPPSVKAPFGSKDPQSGKITYEPDFLLQFAPLCLDTSEDLSQFQNMNEENDRGPRSGMSRRQTSDRSRGPRTPSSPMDMFRHGSRDGRGEMGKFAGGRPLSHRTGSGSHGLPPAGGAGGMQREGSHGGRSRSGRGGKGRHGGKDNQERQEKQQQGAPTIPPEQVVPLEKSENRWVPLALRKQREAEKAAESELLSDEVIIRKVKALLNKLTLEKFDSISGQIWEYAKQSEKEEDGRALKIVIQLTFEKACDEAPFAVMWAQLCRRMYDSITDDIKDVNTLDKHGNVVSGVNLFRKYLLNRCQHDFERGWKMQIPKVDESDPDMLSDEYYAAVKAKRQGLGLVQFIGEMFKRHMLTDRIMLQCLTRLCDNPREVGDEETETMVKMVTTIGRALDTSNRSNKEWMDAYFERMKEMMESPNLSSRVKFMIMDLFDLRKNKWVSRRGNQPAPTTIAQVHQQAQKAKSEEKEAMKRTSSSRGSLPHPMSRAGSHRGGGGARDLQREGSNGGGQAASGDGWNTVTSNSPGGTSKGSRVNELANFGKTDRSKARSNVLGPSNSPFASLHRAKAGGDQKSSPSESRSSSANMFSALGGEEEGQHESAPPAEPATAAPTTTTTTTTSTTGSAPQQDD